MLDFPGCTACAVRLSGYICAVAMAAAHITARGKERGTVEGTMALLRKRRSLRTVRRLTTLKGLTPGVFFVFTAPEAAPKYFVII